MIRRFILRWLVVDTCEESSPRVTTPSGMPLRLDVKRKLLARSDRVKCVDLHPTEPWLLAALYNGNVHIWNYENQQLVKSFEGV
ncbi:hypothetical protein Q1695_005438 [Nippostrongylus brasiliensis]|nr:hypothetical protein Q1695_005438 [Nippostrongylus brasiliensis]